MTSEANPISRLPDMPQLPRDKWPPDGHPAWRNAESLVERGYPYKCRDACSLNKVPHEPGWMNRATGLTAAELGAPVHQALWTVTMRARQE